MSASESRGGRTRRARRPSYYAIGEVCSMLGLKPHVLRYWETQFEELAPTKNRAGNRIYRAEDVELAALIQRLVHDERYTIEGARLRIAEMGEAEAQGGADTQRGRAMERAFLRTLRAELEQLHELLDPSGR